MNNNLINYEIVNNIISWIIDIFNNAFKKYRPITQDIEENEWIDSQIN